MNLYSVKTTESGLLRIRAVSEQSAKDIAIALGHSVKGSWLNFGILGVDYTEKDIIEIDTYQLAYFSGDKEYGCLCSKGYNILCPLHGDGYG